MKWKKILPWILAPLIIISIAAVSKQLIGPTNSTTTHAVVRWADTTGWKTTNSAITIDDYGNMTGVSTQTINEVATSIVRSTNGFIYLQKDSAPTVETIGGTVGSITNHMVVNVNGILYDYWSDGTTLYGPKQLSP